MKKIFFIIVLILLMFFSSCNTLKMKKRYDPVNECINLCNEIKGKVDLSNGPCLSDIYDYEIPDWVCDVAHWPRQDVDNLPQNQCKAYRDGKAHHFVEVDPNCKFIRKY